MPSIRSLAFEHSARHFKLVIVILLFSETMPFCSCCEKKKLVYIIIIALFNCQLSSYSKYTKLNIYSSCDV